MFAKWVLWEFASASYFFVLWLYLASLFVD